MRSIRNSSLIAMVFVALLAIPAGAAQSVAPSYVSSEPGSGETVHTPPERVEVTFSEPLDESSRLTVKDTCGRKLDDGNVSVDANTMTVGIKLKPSGRYLVDYVAKGLGGLTGQKHGGFGFDVHKGTPCDRSGGGGHGGHGGGGNKDGDGGNHGGHEGGGSGGGRHGGTHAGDSGGDHSAMTSGGSGHSGTGHAGDRGGHANMSHDRGGNKHAGKHSNKHGKGHGKGHEDGSHGLLDILEQNEADGSTTAAGEGGPLGPPDGTAVLLALGLSLALGVLGGWFLRMSGAR